MWGSLGERGVESLTRDNPNIEDLFPLLGANSLHFRQPLIDKVIVTSRNPRRSLLRQAQKSRTPSLIDKKHPLRETTPSVYNAIKAKPLS